MASVDNLVPSYVDSTTFLHSPSTIQHSPMDIQGTVLVSGQSSVSLTSEELSPDDLTSSSGHSRLIDPLTMNISGMGMVNPNAVSNRRHGSNHSGSSGDDLPCEFEFRISLQFDFQFSFFLNELFSFDWLVYVLDVIFFSLEHLSSCRFLDKLFYDKKYVKSIFSTIYFVIK